MYCSSCGAKIDDDWNFCRNCGAQVEKKEITAGTAENVVSRRNTEENLLQFIRNIKLLLLTAATVFLGISEWFTLFQARNREYIIGCIECNLIELWKLMLELWQYDGYYPDNSIFFIWLCIATLAYIVMAMCVIAFLMDLLGGNIGEDLNGLAKAVSGTVLFNEIGFLVIGLVVDKIEILLSYTRMFWVVLAVAVINVLVIARDYGKQKTVEQT